MKKLKLLLKLGLFSLLAGLICVVGIYVYAYFSPRLELKNMGKLFIYDNQEKLIYQGSGSSEWVSLNDISQDLINAVISYEDKNFYNHQGFDYLGIVRAMITNIQNRGISQGASTISQQYIRNMYLTFAQTWNRKIEEAFLTVELEVHYNKDEILEGYLNTINYGNGNYGIEEASKYYFNKNSKDLTLEEALLLAGTPKSPNKVNPVADYQKCVKRALAVATTMVRNEYMSEETFNSLFQNDVEVYATTQKDNSQMIMYYQDAVLNELNSLKGIPASLMESGALKVYTTLDKDAQKSMEQAIIDNMDSDDDLQIASVIVNPKTGGILALTGGYDYAVSQYNRATNSSRQIGSTMKPFLYYSALENGMTSSTSFKSEETTFVLSHNKTYSPSNFNSIYANKNITMAAAIAFSDNIYAVKTHLFLGEDKLVETAHKMGIKTELQPNPSLALGTSEINMLDLATGYTTLASGGEKKDLYFIERVEDLNGNVLYERKQKTDIVLNYNYTYILNEMLRGTSNSAFSSYTTPTALSLASRMSRKYAIKTGSTDTDSWIIGYNPDALMLVWTGKDNNEAIPNSISKINKEIWLQTMESYLPTDNQSWYETPQNVVSVIRNAISGETETVNNANVFYYIKGTEYSSISVMNEDEKE